MNAQRVIRVFSLLALGGLVGGCASVQVRPVSVAQVNDPAIAGVRFFQPEPYLLVTQMPARPTPPMPMMMAMMHPPKGPGHGPNHGQPTMMPPAGRWDGQQHNKPMMGKHRGPKDMENHNAPADMPHHAAGDHHDMGAMMGDRGRQGPMHRGHGMARPRPPMPMMGGRMRTRPPQPPTYELQIIYLPDYSHPYVANIQGGLGHSPNSLVLANGWELLGVNVKGKVTQAKPIRAITAAPAMPPHPRMMMHHPMPGMGMAPGRNGLHKKPGKHAVHNWNPKRAWRQRHNMMMHRMMMPGRAAMAMGLHPGLYAFVFNAKTGKLEGLRLVRLLKAHHQHGCMGMMKWNHGPRHAHHAMPAAAPATDSGK